MLFHAVLSFGECSPKAVILHNCTTSASCSYTYEQVYHSLAKSENSFNISSALYPGRSRPSSVRVFVNVYGPNKTKESIPAKYTWSMSCFYSAVPAFALEVLSLGSILVKRRTQDLNLQIPLFCCNISDNEEQRKQQIGSLLIRVLAEVSLIYIQCDTFCTCTCSYQFLKTWSTYQFSLIFFCLGADVCYMYFSPKENLIQTSECRLSLA